MPEMSGNACGSSRVRKPDDAATYFDQGMNAWEAGDLERAIADLDKAILLDPNFASAYSARGLAYRSKGDLDRALHDFDRAIALDPRKSVPYEGRGFIYHQKGELDRAIEDLGRAIELSPNMPSPISSAVRSIAKRVKSRQQPPNFNLAIGFDPGSAAAYNNRGLAY